MLTQEQLNALVPQWRTTTVQGLVVEVRTPTYADVLNAVRLDRPEWWVERCVRSPGGEPLFPPGTDLLAVDGGFMRALENEVHKPCPILPPTGG